MVLQPIFDQYRWASAGTRRAIVPSTNSMLPTRADAKAEYPGVQSVRNGAPKLIERRRSVRLRAQWPVRFWASNPGAPVETVTTDLSSDGFHCLSPVPFGRDEVLACTLTIPETSISLGNGSRRLLECQVRVVRSEPANRDGYFGVACQIKNFRIAAAKPVD